MEILLYLALRAVLPMTGITMAVEETVKRSSEGDVFTGIVLDFLDLIF